MSLSPSLPPQGDESHLVDLAERYAQRFKVDSLGVYDALVNVRQHSMNKSGFVIPAATREAEKVGWNHAPFSLSISLSLSLSLFEFYMLLLIVKSVHFGQWIATYKFHLLSSG